MVFAHAQYDYRTCSAKRFHPAAGPIDTAFIILFLYVGKTRALC